MKTSEALHATADLLQRLGWTKGPTGWEVDTFTGQRLCLEGALMRVTGHYAGLPHSFWASPAYNALGDYLGLPVCGGPVLEAGGHRGLYRWNDAEGRTAGEVVEVLRGAAAIEEAHEAGVLT